MKCVLIVTVCALVVFLGCASSSPDQGVTTRLELVSMTSLPALPERFSTGGMKLNTLFRVLDDGTVAEVKLLSTSGDGSWDLAATDSMRLWHFTTSTGAATPSGRWIHNVVVVQIQEPTLITLGQVKALNRQEADSLYALLENGADFDAMLRQRCSGSADALGVYFGTIDIVRFPEQVRVVLQRLGVDHYTEPIRIGTNYFIYKRYGSDGSRFVPQ